MQRCVGNSCQVGLLSQNWTIKIISSPRHNRYLCLLYSLYDILPHFLLKDEFRNYTDDAMEGRVRATYQAINTQQTVEFVMEQHRKWHTLSRARHTMFEVIDMLANFVDESDPDVCVYVCASVCVYVWAEVHDRPVHVHRYCFLCIVQLMQPSFPR